MSGRVAPVTLIRSAGERLESRLGAALGGPARVKVILLLAAVMSLDSADTATIGAVAPQLSADLHINLAQLGLLASVSTGVAVLATLPMGVLADRVHRVRVLAVTIAVWGAAMAVGGLAPSFTFLLITRLALGVALAAAGPFTVSLVGDLFPAAERGRVFGWILTGEIVGSGVGLMVSGMVAAALSWRAAFCLLALVSIGLAFALWWYLPEPGRGGASWIAPGAERIPAAEPAAGEHTSTRHPGRADGTGPPDRQAAADGASTGQAVLETGRAEPVPDRVLREDPNRMSLWRATRYLLRIPTNVYLIVASSVGYFFFAGMRTFAVVFIEKHYRVAQVTLLGLAVIIGLGAFAGILLGGRLTDRARGRGRLKIRVVVPAFAYAAAALLFAPGLLTTSIWIAAVFFLFAAGAMSAANPPLDAARMDIVPNRMFGRAEAIRTAVRQTAEAIAPLLFGALADRLGGQSSHHAAGLRDAFLIMLVPLLANGLIVVVTWRTYLPDVATAVTSDRTAPGESGPGPVGDTDSARTAADSARAAVNSRASDHRESWYTISHRMSWNTPTVRARWPAGPVRWRN